MFLKIEDTCFRMAAPTFIKFVQSHRRTLTARNALIPFDQEGCVNQTLVVNVECEGIHSGKFRVIGEMSGLIRFVGQKCR